jgi:hypothetical protein
VGTHLPVVFEGLGARPLVDSVVDLLLSFVPHDAFRILRVYHDPFCHQAIRVAQVFQELPEFR